MSRAYPLHVDPAPAQQLVAVMADPDVPSVIFQRLTDGDAPETLAEIAKAWGCPRGKFIEWFTTKHSALYDTALKVRADSLAFETVAIADEQKEAVGRNGEKYDPEVPRDKLRIETRFKVIEKWDRARYGNKEDKSGAGITVIVDRSCGGTVAIQAGGSTLTIAGGLSQERVISGTEASAIPAELQEI